MNHQQQENQNLSGSDCTRIVTLLEEAYTQIELFKRFNATQLTLSRVLTRFAVTGSKSRRPGQGRGRVTTPDQDSSLKFRTQTQRFVTGTSLRS